MILHVTAKEAVDVPKMDFIGESDPYLVFTTSSGFKWKTKYIQDKSCPIWDEEKDIPIKDINEKIHVELYDKDVIHDDLISSMDFYANQFHENETTDAWYIFTPAVKGKQGGKVHLFFHLKKI